MINLANKLIINKLTWCNFSLRETYRNSTKIGSKLYEKRDVPRRATNEMFIRLDKRYIEKQKRSLLFVLKNKYF